MSDTIQCSGQRRYGGAFTFGLPVWERCKNDAVAMLTITQNDGTPEELPACSICWKEANDAGMPITSAKPL